MEEALYYNALAIAVIGSYGKLTKWRVACGNWKSAYRSFVAGRSDVHPSPESSWRNMESAGIRLALVEELSSYYPPLLREIADPPFGLYLKGELPTRESGAPTVAIVGTRRATPEGKNIARRFGKELAEAGFVIVSGLALGIDAAAHEGCLDAGGKTVAVLAGGLDDIYPHENARLAEKILAAGGGIISEYPFGAPHYSGRFLERNRIVSGISRGVLVIEAPERSGSLATANFALDQNRDVFAVPGPVTHPNFAGSHRLIRQGAELVRNSEDILNTYGIARDAKKEKDEAAASTEERLILEALRKIAKPVDVDKIIEMTKLEPRIVNQALAFLLIKNLIRESGTGYTI